VFYTWKGINSDLTIGNYENPSKLDWKSLTFSHAFSSL
jgi:hypothetical protein